MNFEEEKKQTLIHKTIKNGYLYVKLPTNLRSWKAWNKKWIEIKFENNNIDKNKNSVILSVYRNEKSGSIGLRNVVYQQKFQSQNAVIFRCKSRTQIYAFTICNNSIPVIHLAGNSETDSQLWMQCFRKSLWPPNPLMELENSLKGHFYASIIDNENSHRAGLLGAYGYLQVSAKKIILTHPQTGHVIQEWQLSSFDLENPLEKTLRIITNKSIFFGKENIFFYCEDAKEVVTRINKEKEFIKYNKEFEDKFEKQFGKFLSSQTSSKDLKNSNSEFDKIRSLSRSENESLINSNTFRIRTVKEIPETMLNCSLSSPNNFLMYQTINCKITENLYSEPLDVMPNEDFEEDLYEDVEKIYEEIVIKECEECVKFTCNQCLKDKTTRFEDNFAPELPPKKRIISNPIMIRNNNDLNKRFSREGKSKSLNQNEMRGSEIVNYDIFSAIVRETNISLLDRKNLLNSSSERNSNAFEKENLNQDIDNDYCEMRPISSMRANNKSNPTSDSNDYVDMISFSI